MSEQELMLAQVGNVLSQVARPHSCDQTIPVDIQARLWQLGFPCDELTPREKVIAQLWARKRTLQVNLQSLWGGSGPTPPAAA